VQPNRSTPAPTRERILDAGRRLFNERGYAATTQAEIAAAVGISQGNLTYHFATKRDLVAQLRSAVRERIRVRRAALVAGPIADDYVEHLVFAMRLTRDYRFLLRDRAQFGDEPGPQQADAELEADFAELSELLGRIEKDGLFRRDLEIDLRVLARSLWIVGRYWTDYLRESEGLSRIRWAEQERGIRHHFAVLLPYLTAAARREFEAALLRASVPLAAQDEPE
jgi:AcrR family transcriptional regulator